MITRYSFSNCTHVFPFSPYLVFNEYSYDRSQPAFQGIRHHCPSITTPITVIENGFETEKWPLGKAEDRKKNHFLSIAANLDDDSRMKVKGIDLILQTAPLLPDCRFTIIGKNQPAGHHAVPENVTIRPYVPHEELPSVYHRHEFYLQLSMSEGFGNTIAEAMLSGCLMIGSNAGAVPYVIGGNGFILEKKDPQQLAVLIRTAIGTDDNEKEQKRSAARKRVLENFSIEERKRKINAIIFKKNASSVNASAD
jgi:glycosyltransferase involved in cell wall biosynthesis